MDPIDCPYEIGNPESDVGIGIDPIDSSQMIGNLGVILGLAWIQLIALKGLVTLGGDVRIDIDPIDCLHGDVGIDMDSILPQGIVGLR
ncbi:hypothetical protein GBA52_019553 [Prunus armeniaca]|nr:hypothetical protein GBA52_019553 [Prunus armeniaca]